MFCENLINWKLRAVEPDRIRWITRVKNVEQAGFIYNLFSKVTVEVGNESLPKALLLMTKTLHYFLDNDAIILAAQDDQDCPHRWDEIVRKEFEGHDGAVFFNDGIQKPPSEANVMPCLTFGALKKLNRIIYHPDYRHLYCDNEFCRNCTELGLMKDVRLTNPAVFQHNHYSKGGRKMDAVDARIAGDMEADRLTFERRMKLPLSERLK
jgi:hypothetical protein